MRLAIPAARRAFSLLEMVLALALGMVLLLALYVFLNMYVATAQAGRDVLAEAVLVRSVMTRINNDISGQLGPVDPRGLPDPVGVANGVATPPTPAGGTPVTPTPSATPGGQDPVAFNIGVYGQPNYLILSAYRVRKPSAGVATNVPADVVASDVQRTMYWIVPNGSDPQGQGLARAEIKQATSTDIDMAPTDLTDQSKKVFAPEVKTILFEFFDGTTWQTQWDGTTPDAETGLPIGPPAAIRVTITLRKMNNGVEDTGADGATYQQIVALPTANNVSQQGTSP
jgi:hypothetical protein